MFDSGYRFKQQFIIMVSKLVLNLVLNQQACISGSVCQLITWYKVLNLMVSYLNSEILDQAKLINTLLGAVQSAIV